jgi:hypothetical protein
MFRMNGITRCHGRQRAYMFRMAFLRHPVFPGISASLHVNGITRCCDCMDAGSRVTQEQLPRRQRAYMFRMAFLRHPVFPGISASLHVNGITRCCDCMDAGSRVTQEQLPRWQRAYMFRMNGALFVMPVQYLQLLAYIWPSK